MIKCVLMKGWLALLSAWAGTIIGKKKNFPGEYGPGFRKAREAMGKPAGWLLRREDLRKAEPLLLHQSSIYPEEFLI